jgi:hypothetical protein
MTRTRPVAVDLLLRAGGQVEVERRVDAVTARGPVLLALLRRRAEHGEVLDVLLDVVAEVLGARGRHGGAALGRGGQVHVARDVRRERGLHLGLVDVALGLHRLEDDVAPRLVALVLLGRRQVAGVGVLDDGDEAGGLLHREVRRRLVVVVLRGGLDAVGLVAEVGDVEVRQEDRVLRVLLLEADRELHLLELAVEGRRGRLLVGGVALFLRVELLRLGDADVAHQLHGERRSAAARAELAAAERAHRGPDERRDVDAPVVVEATVLTGEDGVLEVRGDLVPLELDAVLAVEGREGDVLPALLGVEGVALRQLADLDVLGDRLEDADGARGRHARDGDGRGHADRHEEPREDAEADESEERPDDGRGLRFLGRHKIRVSDTDDIRAERNHKWSFGST